MSKRRPSGTFEWAKHSAFCAVGCENNCQYCYSRYTAVEKLGLKTYDTWEEMELLDKEMKKNRPLKDGTIMFPTTHDITPTVLEGAKEVLLKMLSSGNQVLIVSKPRLGCIMELCSALREYTRQVLYRFTIGALDDNILRLWEPGAPRFQERMDSLRYARESGYMTSVSCEPLLEAERVVDLFYTLEPFVTDSIWIGKMNRIEQRVLDDNPELQKDLLRIEAGQTDDRIKEIYNLLGSEPKVKWKESYKEILGLDAPEEIGLDI